MLSVKGKELGTGRPLICVPIMESTKEGIWREATRLQEQKVDMIEWRVDAFEDGISIEAIEEVLQGLEGLMKDTVLVYTFRTAKQGGLMSVADDVLHHIHMAGASSEAVDFVDVEYYGMENVENEINSIHEAGSLVIGSHHNFSLTPSRDEIMYILESMELSDVVKLAVMPNGTEDVIRLLDCTNAYHKNYPNVPLITMAMGPVGAITRVAGEFFGSCVTFGAGETASAPGQLPMIQLDKVLNILHESIVKE